ncbi:hypothetical protein JXM67_11080 [candidate division WOR-3 bacterium]|nr:hypothetical protein [candidate division WOR-3 bacterium]
MIKAAKISGLVFLAVLSLAAPSLTPPISYNINLTYEIVPDEDSIPEGGVKLIWEEPYSPPDAVYSGGCKGTLVMDTTEREPWQYIIILDGEDVDTVTHRGEHYDEQVYYLYTPCATIVVCPYYDGERYDGEVERIEFHTTEDNSVYLYPVENSIYEEEWETAGFGFDHSAYASSYYVNCGDHWHAIDYYVDTSFILHAGIDHDPSLNGRESSLSTEEIGYDELGIVKGFDDENYQLSAQLEEGGVYGLRVETRASGLRPSGEIHYCKLEVVDLDDEKVELRILYQWEIEFRWVVEGED